MTSEAFDKLIPDFRSKIDEALSSLVRSQEPTYLYDPVKYVFRGGGKRLRPILVFLAAKMFGVPEEEAIPAALSVEILHNFSLTHDDIMDRDEMRHGRPSVFHKWDESTAILAGDTIFALAYVELTKIKRNSLACIRTFNAAAIKLCEGQALDKDFETRESVSLEEYFHMVKLKTGTLLSLCGQLGAIMGEASEDDRRRMAEFGELLGQSFQIQDDVLEIYSSAEKMGKSLGSDVATRKKTYLTCRALERDSSGWKKLMETFKDGNLESEVLPALRTYFGELGILREANETVDHLVALSRSKLKHFDRGDREGLEHFVNLIIVREH